MNARSMTVPQPVTRAGSSRARVLLVSTEPASNLGQGLRPGDGKHLTDVPDVPLLTALKIDPEAAAQGYRDRISSPVRGVLPDDAVRGLEEQLWRCRTEVGATAEFTGARSAAGHIESNHRVDRDVGLKDFRSKQRSDR